MSRSPIAVLAAGVLLLLLTLTAGASPQPPDRPAGTPQGDRVGGATPAPVTGSQAWIVLLCEYLDSDGDPTFTPEYTSTMFKDATWGLETYFSRISYGKITLTTTIRPYRDMPNIRQYYIDIPSANDRAGALFDDCTAAHDAEVDFGDYAGVVVLLDKNIGFGGLGGSHYAILDGVDRVWPFATTGANSTQGFNAAVTAHEMLHAFGLPHARGGSFFDVMSVPGAWCPDAFKNKYTCYPEYTNAWHVQELLGWIDAPKVYQAGPGKNAPITIERLALPRPNSNFLMAKVAIPNTEKFYVLEVRLQLAGSFDYGLPNGAGVIMHRVSTAPEDNLEDYTPADLVAEDKNDDGFWDPDSAYWGVGETFEDKAAGISVKVTASDGAAFTVVITTPDPVAPSQPTLALADRTTQSATLSDKPVVKTTLSATDNVGVTGWLVSENGATPAANAAGWRATPPTTFRLSAGDGVKAVYAWAKDGAGNVSPRAKATIRLDTKKPAVAIVEPAARATMTQLRKLRGTATEPKPGSGLASADFAIRRKAGPACSWWNPTTQKLVAGSCAKKVWNTMGHRANWAKTIGKLDTPGTYLVYVRFTDKAGNTGTARQAFVIKR